jgi:hypothetical protein
MSDIYPKKIELVDTTIENNRCQSHSIDNVNTALLFKIDALENCNAQSAPISFDGTIISNNYLTEGAGEIDLTLISHL